MIILTPETKTCMSHLLAHETFDHFSFIEGEIITFGKFTMSGFLQKSFFDEPPKEEYALWKLFRDYCYSIIRGKRTPLSFRLIFSLAPEEIGKFLSDSRLDFPLSDVQGLYLNFRYDGSKLTCTTGTSFRQFIMDKSVEQAWDKKVQELFFQNGIPYELDS